MSRNVIKSYNFWQNDTQNCATHSFTVYHQICISPIGESSFRHFTNKPITHKIQYGQSTEKVSMSKWSTNVTGIKVKVTRAKMVKLLNAYGPRNFITNRECRVVLPFGMQVRLQISYIKYIYEDNWVKVKITGVNKKLIRR